MLGQNRYLRDVLGGALVMGIGLFMVWYATTYFELGTISNMGSGMLPTMLGGILMVLGALIVLPALIILARRSALPGEAMEPVAWRPLFFVLGSIGVFAFGITRFGIVPSVFALSLVASFADSRRNIPRTLILGALIALLIVAVFKYGLGVTTPLFRWPF